MRGHLATSMTDMIKAYILFGSYMEKAAPSAAIESVLPVQDLIAVMHHRISRNDPTQLEYPSISYAQYK